ncbi:hypothetical protein [Melittangium boletus]|uniref:Peptidase S1 domain-containing protein n=1 Tax=Melittangium boletus DSM 14713 TaxID=1294270 RepID=A0A250IK80_9BACT|nr:hypothetical protein [Melittangium boletus]ATB31316.1 hypothetical protein MEBOL_004778 [Melittangium boletus DSM 14713]
MKSTQPWLSCLILMSSPALAATSGAEVLPDRAALERSAATAMRILTTVPNTDEALLQMEALMPHMGGFYLGEDGAAHVLLTEDASEGERLTARSIGDAVSKMRSFARGQTQQRLTPTVVEPARFRFSELARIRDYATDVLNLEDVQSLDANERANQVSVGVLSEEAAEHAREYWARLELPPESLEVFLQPRIEAMATLSSYVRPVPGGYSIRNGNFSYTTCTLGYPVFSSVLGMFGFITNSHCTDVSGGVENTSFYQGNPFVFATEYLDPIFQTSSSLAGCPSGQLCRLSDSAFAGGTNYPSGALKEIAQTINYCSLPQTHCSTTVNSSSPVIYPHGFASSPLVGQYFEKVGQTTGWTYGQLQQSCTTVRDSASGHYFVCQYTVAAGVDAGDSGSPVFTWDGTNNPIGGILWGGDPTYHDYFVFSHYSSINTELGTMYYY